MDFMDWMDTTRGQLRRITRSHGWIHMRRCVLVLALVWLGAVQSPGNASIQVTISPESPEVIEGETVVLSTSVAGEGPFAYQWRYGGADLFGRTAPTLRLPNVTAEQQGTYSVMVSSALATNTASVSVIVRKKPLVLSPGQTNIVAQGGWARFDIIVQNDLPL